MDTLQELNTFIEKIQNNVDFAAMLDDNNQNELDAYYSLTQALKKNYRGLINSNTLPNGINGLKVDLTPSQCENLIIDFFASIGIPKEKIANCLSTSGYKNLKVVPNLDRAYQKDGIIYVGEFTNTLDWLKTVVHEMAHYLRSQNTNGIAAIYGTYNEIESKVTEQAFYQYLLASKKPIIVTENGLRCLNQSDIKLQNLREIILESQNLFRFQDEYWFVKKLRSNLKKNGTYQFTKEDLSSLTPFEQTLLKNTTKWQKNYIKENDSTFFNSHNYSLHNGKHITNEFRFIIARLYSEYALSNPFILANFGTFLLNSQIKDKSSLENFFGITNYDELIKNQINNSTSYVATYITSLLTEKSKEYLSTIKSTYGKDMSEEELTYLQKLQESNCVVVDSDTTRYKNNQLAHGIALDDYKVPYAHGSRVFNDDKIHFYLPAILKRNPNITLDDIIKRFDSLLTHELLHFFIRPKANEFDGEKVSNFITEGLVDMATRDIHKKNKLSSDYQSDYGPNVIFVRQALSNISKEERGRLLFNSDIETFLKRTSTKAFNSKQTLKSAIDKTTSYDILLSSIADAYSTSFPVKDRENIKMSALRQLYNLSANEETISLSLEKITEVGNKYYKEAMPKISDLINAYNSKTNDINISLEQSKENTVNKSTNPNLFDTNRAKRQAKVANFATMSLEEENIYHKMLAAKEQLSLDSSVTKAKPMSRVLTKKENTEQNNNDSNSGFISTLLLSLGVGFISGVVSVLSYLFISRG